MKKILLLFFYVFISITVFAQSDFRDGYIVTHENDTIYGEIALRSNLRNANSCVFRNESKMQIYTPKEISKYRILGEKYYVSKKLKIEEKEEILFLEFLVEGIANLYYLKKSNDEYFIIEKEGRLVPLTNKEFILQGKDGGAFAKESEKFRGVMLYYFRDAPQLANKIKQTEFNYKGLVNITKDYHNAVCTDYKCLEYSKSTVSNIFMESVAGVAINKMGLNSADELINSIVPNIGLNFVFKPYKAHYVWNVVLGVSYQKSDFSGRINDYDNVAGEYLDLDIQYDEIRIPLKVRYEFPGKKIQPFISAGMINSVLLNPKSVILNKRSEYTSREEDASMKNYQLGFGGSLGLKYKLSDKNYLIFEAEYENKKPRSGDHLILDDQFVRSLVFSFGYAFKI